jgi:two-component system sensor histidine kinase YesM
VMKLTLQPLVENAIYHGIKERRGHGTIRVEALRRDRLLVLRVSDDGVGMTTEKLAEVERILDGSSGETKRPGYGMRNVQQRIQLSFGSDYGLHYESVPERGTTVEVHHPLVGPQG